MECRIKRVLSNMTNGTECTPWYYPPVNPDTRMCSPFEAQDFTKSMELISLNECRVLIKLLKLFFGTLHFTFPALLAQLWRNQLLCECVSSQVSGLQLQEHGNEPHVQSTRHCHWKWGVPWLYSDVGNQCDGWLQVTKVNQYTQF